VQLAENKLVCTRQFHWKKCNIKLSIM